MKARHARIGHGGGRRVSRLGAIVVVSAFAHGSAAWGQCNNDAGTGDIAEGEVCAGDFYADTTNGGCNSTPSVFTTVPSLPTTFCGNASNYNNTRTCTDDLGCDTDGDGIPDGVCNLVTGLCEGPNEPSVNRRDTDWYRVRAADLALADTDGNGTVRITSAVTGEMRGPGVGLDLVTFMITVDNLVDCNPSVLSNVGCWDSTGGTGQTIASNVITISENPCGVVVFVAPGLCTGGGIFGLPGGPSFECTTGLNDYIVTIAADATFEDGTFTACGDPAQNPQLGPCGEPNPGVNGCEDPECCAIVCTEYTPFCCTHELGWIQQCADAAIDLGCFPIPVTGLGLGASTTVIVHTTYGAASPLGIICDPLPCPWDCDSAESTDGTVGIVDFLTLLAQWGGPGSCDFDGGGVGIVDFLALLAHWGACP